MKLNKSLILLFILPSFVLAQIDTTNWYPLQIGNTWQFSYYISISETSYITFEVIGDTTINQKSYYIIESWNGFTFQRVEDNKFVYEYNPYSDQEYVRYNFVSPDKSIWDLDSVSGQYGIYSTIPTYINIIGDTLESKVYNTAFIDTNSIPPDTSWGPMVDGTSKFVTKGIGITVNDQGFNQGSFKGAIINGVTIGTLTDVKFNTSILSPIELKQNYPNPFNPTTNISYKIPNSNEVKIIIYNSLGQIVKTLVNEFQKRGSYKIQFDGSNLSSGIYFYQIKTDNYQNVKKMLLLK